MRRRLPIVVAVLAVATFYSSIAGAQRPKRRAPKPKPKPSAPAHTKPEPAKDAAKPDKVNVTVVELAGGNAYLKPGAAAGVRRNSHVTIERQDYVVTSSTADFAVIELGDSPAPREQATGVASIVNETEDEAKQLPPPRPLDELRGQWSAWHPPAESQHPKPVPLGLPDRNHRYDVMVYGYAGGVNALGDRGGGYLRAEVGLRMHLEPFSRPLALDVDGSMQRWFGAGIYDRVGARPIFRVRELQLGYGDRASTFAGLGRIRYAAATLGALDGLRVRAPIGRTGLSAAAFGGFLPDPGNGALRTDSQRFGAELGFSRPELTWRPEAAVVVHGSTYDGRLDERRVAALAGIYPGQSRIGAHVEASAFDKDNPWRVDPFEITAAGVDGRVNIGAVQLGAHADMRQQERSRYIATFLPPSWFCQRVPTAAPPSPDTCDPRSTTLYQAGVDAGVTLHRFSLFAGGLASMNLVRPDAPSQAGLFVNGRVLSIFRVLRIDATGTASTGTLMDLFSGGGGPGVSLLADRLDASIYYRRTVLQYRVGDVLNNDSIGGYLTAIPHRDFVASLQAEGTDGEDYRAVMGSLVLVWRPRL